MFVKRFVLLIMMVQLVDFLLRVRNVSGSFRRKTRKKQSLIVIFFGLRREFLQLYRFEQMNVSIKMLPFTIFTYFFNLNEWNLSQCLHWLNTLFQRVSYFLLLNENSGILELLIPPSFNTSDDALVCFATVDIYKSRKWHKKITLWNKHAFFWRNATFKKTTFFTFKQLILDQS